MGQLLNGRPGIGTQGCHSQRSVTFLNGKDGECLGLSGPSGLSSNYSLEEPLTNKKQPLGADPSCLGSLAAAALKRLPSWLWSVWLKLKRSRQLMLCASGLRGVDLQSS